MKRSRGFVWLPILLVILGVLAVSGGAYWYGQQTTTPPAQEQSSGVAPVTDETKGTKTSLDSKRELSAQIGETDSVGVIYSPQGGGTLYAGSPQAIERSLDTTSSVEINLERKLPTDAQFWHLTTIASGQPHSGTYIWRVSGVDSSGKSAADAQYRILIGANLAKGTGPVVRSGAFSITDSDARADPQWAKYSTDVPYSLEFSYPKNFTVEGGGDIDRGFQIDIKNFAWDYNAYSFSYIKVLPVGRFYVQIWGRPKENSTPLASWLQANLAAGYNSPERVQVVDEYKNITGTLKSQKTLTINGREVVQREIEYTAQGGSITILYTYLDAGNVVFQFINHNPDPSTVNVYQSILASFKVGSTQ